MTTLPQTLQLGPMTKLCSPRCLSVVAGGKQWKLTGGKVVFSRWQIGTAGTSHIHTTEYVATGG